jgi:hypothetical protein
MKAYYQSYKDTVKRSGEEGKKYNLILRIYGGLQKMTQAQHEWMVEFCDREVNEEGRRVQPSPMGFALSRSVFSKRLARMCDKAADTTSM